MDLLCFYFRYGVTEKPPEHLNSPQSVEKPVLKYSLFSIHLADLQ